MLILEINRQAKLRMNRMVVFWAKTPKPDKLLVLLRLNIVHDLAHQTVRLVLVVKGTDLDRVEF